VQSLKRHAMGEGRHDSVCSCRGNNTVTGPTLPLLLLLPLLPPRPSVCHDNRSLCSRAHDKRGETGTARSPRVRV
jgi:hypothetical protein